MPFGRIMANLNGVVAGGDIPSVMPPIELLDTQSLLLCHNYLLTSVEEVESGEDLDGSSV